MTKRPLYWLRVSQWDRGSFHVRRVAFDDPNARDTVAVYALGVGLLAEYPTEYDAQRSPIVIHVRGNATTLMGDLAGGRELPGVDDLGAIIGIILATIASQSG